MQRRISRPYKIGRKMDCRPSAESSSRPDKDGFAENDRSSCFSFDATELLSFVKLPDRLFSFSMASSFSNL